jgi:hypothetical protein
MKTLKIMMMTLVMCSVFTSCSKEEDDIYNCNCGVVLSRDSLNFSVKLENTCSKKEKIIYLSKPEFDTLGQNLCLYGNYGGRIVW